MVSMQRVSGVALAWACGIAAAFGIVLFTARPGAGGSHDARKHSHESSHGGAVQAVGNHHAEAVMEKGGTLRLFVLGRDESELVPVAEQKLRVQVQEEGELESQAVELIADPQPGDPEGQASSFAGRLPEELTGKPLTVALTLPLAGKAYRTRFELKPHRADEIHPEMAEMLSMPPAAGSDEVSELYGRPGGLYTEADIRVNGSRPAAEKFRGIVSIHDKHPRPGERICPITSTKANPRFTWTIGGKAYLFCCPPCIDEFVKRAKEQPESIEPPQSYVQK